MSNESGRAAPAPEPKRADAVVIDLGKHRKKRVKALRKGRGKLMAQIDAALEELREQGAVAADAQPVIVIVRERRGTLTLPGL